MIHFGEKRYTFLGILTIYFWLFLLCVIVLGYVGSDEARGNTNTWAVVGLITVLVLAIVTYFFQKEMLKRHALNIQAQAEANGWEYSAEGTVMNVDRNMVLSLLTKDENSYAKLRNHVTAQDWEYSDYLYDFYHRYKQGRLKAGEKSYAILSITLPRILPNVLFDSATSKRKQFSTVFAGNQTISLEGDFDRYFTTYFPVSYRVDSLSFITPEVMESLIRAKDYDIEIIHDKLYLFAPFRSGAQVVDMASKAADIKRTLLHNILTYRDERLPYEQGRVTVAPGASKLQRSKWPLYVTIATMILYIALHVVADR